MSAAGMAQVVRDGTIGPGASVQPVGPAYVITQSMGATAGSNLFHSFSQFGLAQGQSATFTGTGPIDNVIARVTGASSSVIDGVLSSRIPGADLWLINPRGVMFGSHAVLNLDGSLNVSTADTLDFDNGADLRTQPVPPPVLSVAAPTAFRLLGGAPGRIEVNGTVLRNPAGFSMRSGAIEISDGGALAAGTNDSARGGDIELVASERISLRDAPSVRGMQGFGTVDSRTVGPGAAGDIRLEAPVIEVLDGARVRSVTGASGAGGDISLLAAERLTLAGNSSVDNSPSEVATVSASTGAGGNLYVNTASLEARDLATLESDSYGAGAGGDITVAAGRVELDESSEIASHAGSSGRGGDIAVTATDEILVGGHSSEVDTNFGALIIAGSGPDSTGHAGAVTIKAPVILITGGGGIGTATSGAGHAGDLYIEADDLTVSGYDKLVSFVGAASFGSGDAGNLVLHIGRLQLENGGSVVSTTYDSGRGGDTEIVATEGVTVTGTGGERANMPDGDRDWMLGGTDEVFRSNIVASARGAGDAGNIEITAPTVMLANGGSISSNTSASGNGGTIVVTADELTLDGAVTDDRAKTEIRADSGVDVDGSGSRGDAGEITLIVGTLELTDGANITSSSLGSGNAGSIRVEARDGVRVAGNSTITTEARDANGDSGEAGEISITAGRLDLVDGARISSSSLGSADAGSITIQVRDGVLVAGDSAITTEAQGSSGGAGEITLIAGDVDLVDGARISSSSLGSGDAGDICIAARGRMNIDSAAITTDASNASGGNIEIGAAQGLTVANSEISTSVMSGTGNGGNITIGADQLHGIQRPDSVVFDDARVVAKADAGHGGRITISSDVFLASGNSTVDASATSGVDGNVTVEAVGTAAQPRVESLAVQFVDATSLLRQQCAVHDSRFVVQTRRGQMPSPEEMLLAFDDVDRSTTPDLQLVAASGSLLDGESMLRNGRDEDAAATFRGLATSAIVARDAGAGADALRGLGQSLQARGLFADSLTPLRSALSIAESIDDRGRVSAALVNLGNAQLAIGDTAAASDSLTRAVVLAQLVDDTPLLATAVNAVGNKFVSIADFESALASFEKSVAIARRAGDPHVELLALANAARTALRLSLPERAQDLMEEARASVYGLPTTPDKVQLLVHLGRSYAELSAAAAELREPSLLAAFEALSTAEALSRTMPDQQRARSYALGNLAALYEREQRVPEALYLNAQALAAADQAGAADASYRWSWQEGRLEWSQGHVDAAIKAYRRAVDLLEETRQGGLARYGATNGHFREAIAPVYRDLVDALLRASEMASEPAAAGLLLEEARQTMEQLQAAELRDYFHDECAAESQDVFQAHWPATAVVYPIVLADRLELLVSLPDGIEHHQVAVSAEDLTREALAFRQQLEERAPARRYQATARRLYEWLVAPYAESLAAAGVETLVFVPDGALRSIPVSALYDGTSFLVERFATVRAASLALADPRPLQASHHALLAGLSESVAGFPRLPHVPEELDSIRATYGGRVLLDDSFTLARFESAMADHQPAIVHIASHGRFTGDPGTSFLLTHDGALSMSELEHAVSERSIPLDLLVLSACQTAAGDDRAALGLAGVSLRAGARSAIGSLWNVSDAATALLFEDFYRKLSEPGSSRGAAMREAQKALLASERFHHPFFWSGFLLINSWL
jgi:filamentous hemagglutinin family protein